MFRTYAAVAFLLLAQLASAQIAKIHEVAGEVGTIIELRHPDVKRWLPADPIKWIERGKDSFRVYEGGEVCVLTSAKPDKIALYATKSDGEVDCFVVTISGDAPLPGPEPEPDPEPEPEPPPLEGLAEQIKQEALKLSVADRAKSNVIADVFEDVADNGIGKQGIFTGPEIRAYTERLLETHLTGGWQQWDKRRNELVAQLMSEQWGSPERYREAWRQIAEGLRAAAPPVAQQRVVLDPRYFRIRDGRLERFSCQNGRCAWRVVQ